MYADHILFLTIRIILQFITCTLTGIKEYKSAFQSCEILKVKDKDEPEYFLALDYGTSPTSCLPILSHVCLPWLPVTISIKFGGNRSRGTSHGKHKEFPHLDQVGNRSVRTHYAYSTQHLRLQQPPEHEETQALG